MLEVGDSGSDHTCFLRDVRESSDETERENKQFSTFAGDEINLRSGANYSGYAAVCLVTG